MSSFRDLVATYYPRIDVGDTAWVLTLFAPDAIYQRAGATYRGRDELRKFFCEDRQIRGEHLVDGLWTDDATRTVIATGRFEGTGAAGDRREVGFADVWNFNVGGLVGQRRTYLALGQEYVRS
jgi:hypothetical protein